jgi:hypothetical protein
MGTTPSSSDHHHRTPKAPPTSPRNPRFIGLPNPPTPPNIPNPNTSNSHNPATTTLNTNSNPTPNLSPNHPTSTPGNAATSTSPPNSARIRFTVPGLQLSSLSKNRDEKDEPPISVRFTKKPQTISSIKTPPLSPRESYADREVKIFHFIYNGIQKDLKVYEGTPADLVWRTLFQQLGLLTAGGTNMEILKDSVSLSDSDGCPVVFSPEHIPHDEKLFVQFHNLPSNRGGNRESTVNNNTERKEKKSVSSEESSQTETSDASSEGSDMEFEWDVKWNSLYCGYNLLDNDRTITTGTSAVSRSSSMPILISNRSFKKGTGVYKWRIVFKEEKTHHAAGIVSEEEISFPRKCASFGNHFPSVPWFFKTSPMGEKETIIILDTNKSKVTINGKVYEGIPDSVYAAVCFKMPISMEARLLFDVE